MGGNVVGVLGPRDGAVALLLCSICAEIELYKALSLKDWITLTMHWVSTG